MTILDKIFKYAEKFYKLAQVNNSVGKQWILDQFFNTFKDGSYTLIYDYFESEDELSNFTDTVSPWGASVKLKFIDKTNDVPDNVKSNVESKLRQSLMKPYIHSVFVTYLGGEQYLLQIQFNSLINQVV